MNYTIEKEFYRFIPSFPEYRISNYANIKNNKKDTYIKSYFDGEYYKTTLRYNKKPYKIFVHQIIIRVFQGEAQSNNYTVDHIDCNKENNYPSNLRYLTSLEQSQNKMMSKNIKGGYSIQSIDIQSIEITNEFQNINESIKMLNLNLHDDTIKYHIRECLKGNKYSFNGFIWKYSTPYNLSGEIWEFIPKEIFTCQKIIKFQHVVV